MAGRAVIVGGGPAGAALGYVLAARGVETTLIERHHDFSREFRGEMLQPSGITCFTQMGLRDALMSLPHAAMEASDVYRDKAFKFVMPLESSVEDGPFLAPQPLILEMLVREASRFANFKLLRGGAAKALLQDARGRVTGVRATHDGQAMELAADAVVAADGRYSTLRKLAGLEDAKRPSEHPEFDVVWTRVPTPEFMRNLHRARLFLGRNNVCLFMPTPDGKLQVGWIIKKGTFAGLKELGVQGFLDGVSNILDGQMERHLRAHADEIELVLLNVMSFDLERWWVPGLLLIGDACHPMSPAGGQGVNIALRDAIVAGNHLGAALADGAAAAAIDRAMAAVQAEREPEVLEIQALQAKAPRLLNQDDAVSRALAGMVFPFLTRVAPGVLEAIIKRGNAKFLSGVTDVQLDPELRRALHAA